MNIIIQIGEKNHPPNCIASLSENPAWRNSTIWPILSSAKESPGDSMLKNCCDMDGGGVLGTSPVMTLCRTSSFTERLSARAPSLKDLGDLYTESGQTLQGSFSAVSKPIFASKYALESSRRDLHNAFLCTVLESNPKKRGKPFSNLNFFVKNRQNFFAIELMNIH